MARLKAGRGIDRTLKKHVGGASNSKPSEAKPRRVFGQNSAGRCTRGNKGRINENERNDQEVLGGPRKLETTIRAKKRTMNSAILDKVGGRKRGRKKK